MVASMFVLFLIVVLGASWTVIKMVKKRKERHLTLEIKKSLEPVAVKTQVTVAGSVPRKRQFSPAMQMALPLAQKFGLIKPVKPLLPFDEHNQIVVLEEETIDVGAVRSDLERFIAAWAEWVPASEKFKKAEERANYLAAKGSNFSLSLQESEVDTTVNELINRRVSMLRSTRDVQVAIKEIAPLATHVMSLRKLFTDSAARLRPLSAKFEVPESVAVLSERSETTYSLSRSSMSLAEKVIARAGERSEMAAQFVEDDVLSDQEREMQAQIVTNLTAALKEMLVNYVRFLPAATSCAGKHAKVEQTKKGSQPNYVLPDQPDQAKALALVEEVQARVHSVLVEQEEDERAYEQYRLAEAAYQRSITREDYLVAASTPEACLSLKAAIRVYKELHQSVEKQIAELKEPICAPNSPVAFAEPGAEPKDEPNLLQAVTGQTRTLTLAIGALQLALTKYNTRKDPYGPALTLPKVGETLIEDQIFASLDAWSERNDKSISQTKRLEGAHAERLRQLAQAVEKLTQTVNATTDVRRPTGTRTLHLARQAALELLKLPICRKSR